MKAIQNKWFEKVGPLNAPTVTCLYLPANSGIPYLAFATPAHGQL